MSRTIMNDEDGCWNCERGCVPNFYDTYRCPWKHDPEKEKRYYDLYEKLKKYNRSEESVNNAE